ncbi:MAG: 2-oxoacid:acceptor oxidoreductase subunit alpha, partial [Deltaproteobacteria bacterium]|nr:2-oxoacid:acceptor oxidoreductase subunit alpha [Deltaproteobacteria bacterium]
MSDAPSSHDFGPSSKPVETLESVVIRFAGDSGDGIQLTGNQFTAASAAAGNDTATFPDYPAEIRAPVGTLAGVSGFQLHFSSKDILTPGDRSDVLVVMNPAALAAHKKWLKPGGVLIANADAFNQKNLLMAGFAENPLENDSLADYQLFKVDLARLTGQALEGMGLSAKEIERCKNYFALGMVFWLYERDVAIIEDEIDQKFASKPLLKDANHKVFQAGWNFGENTELFRIRYRVPAAQDIAPGRYRSVSGNEAVALGMVAASVQSGRQLFLGSYPITPATDILHSLSTFKEFGVKTFQAEDEIAGICSAIGAAFGNALAITTTSGPGVALKTEAMGLAVMTELPLVIVNVQRGGPSTGLPTKTEQADLLQAIYGRNGESPMPVIAARSPSDAFEAAFEACRVAIKYRTPVMLLSDGYIANGAEPWLIPRVDTLPKIDANLLTSVEQLNGEKLLPYLRDPGTLARPWIELGNPGLEHRIGGLEKWDKTGHIAYDPQNHHNMVKLRQAKVDAVVQEIPATPILGKESGELLVVTWGSPWGSARTAVRDLIDQG